MNPTQVPIILAHLMSDHRIARAAHPVINAWRCQVGPLMHQDNDDDGETAAGGRLAHLLQILVSDPNVSKRTSNVCATGSLKCASRCHPVLWWHTSRAR
jgi:hypothetical protein